MTLEEIRKELVGKDLRFNDAHWRIKSVGWDKENHYYVVEVETYTYSSFVFSKDKMSRLLKGERVEDSRLWGNRYCVFRSLSKDNFKAFLPLVREMRNKQREGLDSGDEEREVDKFLEEVERGLNLE